MQCRVKRLLLAAMAGALALATQVTQALTAGDISLIGYRADASDGIAFVSWVALPAGTSLYFTDAGFFSDGTLRDSEDIMSWTAPAGGVAAGTVVVVSCPNSTASADLGTVSGSLEGISASGDQVFVGDTAFPDSGDTSMPGSSYSGTLLFGLGTEAAWITTGTPSANTSHLPAALNGPNLNLAFSSAGDNGQYTGARTGMTIAEYKAAIVNPANWTREDAGTTVLSSTDFAIASSAPSVAITDPANPTLAVANGTSDYTLSGTSANAVGRIAWTNSLTHASGTVAAGASWSIPSVGLDVGDNAIAVTGTNAVGTAASDSVTITRAAALTPSLTISDPADATATVGYSTSAYTLAGTSANTVGRIAWTNSLTHASGTVAAGANWSIPSVALGVGDNVLTVGGTNVNGVAASDSVTITRNPEQVLAAGDIMFVAYNADGQDGFAIAAMGDIPANTTIYFCDSEWNGSGFVSSEGDATWVTPGSIIPAGTVVRFYLGTGQHADQGTFTSTMALGNSDEGVFCFLGTGVRAPTTFLAAVGNGTESASFGALTGTGLTLGDTAFLFGDDWDVAQYVGARDDQTTFAAYRAPVYTAANWQYQDASGDQNADSIAPDEPFDSTPFTLAGQPLVTITDPAGETANVSPATSSTSVAGTSLNVVGVMTWANAATAGSGTFAADANWTAAAIGLSIGANPITISGTNVAGTVATDTVTITRDAIAVTLTQPAAALVTVDNAVSVYSVTGTTENAAGTMTWTNTLTGAAGSFTAGATWHVDGIALNVGDNTVTVSATNAQGTAASDSVNVRRFVQVADLYTGDIAVTGFNADGNDNLAIVALRDLPADTTIFFADNAWYGDAFGTTESAFKWTVGPAAISAGTIVRFDSISNGEGGSPLVSTSHGSVTNVLATNLGLSKSAETIYFYLGGDEAHPVRFLAAVSTESAPNLSGTGLTLGQTALKLATGCDIAAYTNARSGQLSFPAYLPLVNDPANWVRQDGGTAVYADSIDPDLPFDGTAFVVGAAAPALAVTTADGSVPYATTDVAIDGTFANIVGAIVWSNELSDATGMATVGAATWSATVPLAVGANLIVVSGTNTQGTVASDSVTITRQDAPAASITITTADAVVPYATATLEAIEGSAANAVGTMVLSNSLGGSDEQPAGAAWTFEEVPLAVGVNEITITVSNVAGTVASDTVTIIRQAQPATDAMRIAAFSDPHYFATNLLINDGPAFQTYLAQDRKLIAESAAITKAVVDQIIARNANYVLVSGDLTKDGELASHVAFSNELARIEDAGAQVLVIPGNHDVNSPEARSYDGATTNAVPTVSPEQFKAIYAPFGYDLASAADAGSLAYAVNLTPDVRLVCLDSCQYAEGQDPVAGSFDAARLAWATNQMALAQAEGDLVLGMMHHNLMEHFPNQNYFFDQYVLDGNTTVAPLFVGAGLKAVFTGHFHANDIVQGSFSGRTLYEIETGSTVTWPCPYRVMELDAQGSLEIVTHQIEAIDYDLGDAATFPEYAEDYLWSGMLGISSNMLAVQFGLPPASAAMVAPAVSEAIIEHYAGDEPTLAGATPQTQGIVAFLKGAPATAALGYAVEFILTDTLPADNNVTLDLDPAPAVSLTAPADGTEAPINQPVTVTATASDERGVTNVAIRVNDVTVASFEASPYTTAWTPTVPGSYALTAVAYDNAGQSTVSATVTVQTPPLSILSPADGSTVESGTDETTVSFVSVALVGTVTFYNATTGETIVVPAGTTSADLGLAYGINVIVVTGNDGSGDVSDTITITRLAPTPVNGGDILPEWDYLVDNGTVHIAWTTNDWYQFQSTDACLPGTLLFRDPVGGTLEPGAGDPAALTDGATHFRYDALDGTRFIVVEDDADFRVRVPCFSAATLSAPRTNEVWMQVAYWDAPGNPEWIQDWQLAVTPESGTASAPVLMGRVHGADGLITEAYAFTVVGSDTAFEVAFAANPALDAANPGFVSAITIDTRVRVPLAIADPAEDAHVGSGTDHAVVAVHTDGLLGTLTFRNTSTGQAVVVPEGTSSADLALAYGDNVIVVTGTDGADNTVIATVTLTRDAPVPLNGTAVLPNWDGANGTGTVHVAWTTNDWYQFQSDDICLPGTFRFRDPFGGTLIEPGDGNANATNTGLTHFRYDAPDRTRSIGLEADDAFAVRVPCYTSALTGLAMNQSVWLQIVYWDVPGNPGWVQGWQLDVTAEGPVGAGATTPVLMGRVHGADGLITEAYAFTVTGDATAFAVSLAGDPALSARNTAYVSDLLVDVLSDTAAPSHRIVTTASGSGAVSRGSILLARGASTNVVIEAAAWYRIHALATNGVAVAAATGASNYTQQFANVTQDYHNQVVFGYRANALNADGVPTSWLAGFGKGEDVPLVYSDRSIGDKYLLDVDPYVMHAVLFEIESFAIDGGFADVTVKLLVDGAEHDHINGFLQLDGRETLEADWTPVGGTPVTGSVFSNGTHDYRIDTDTNRFFRAVVR